MPECIGVDPTCVIRVKARGLPEPSSKPWHERQRIIASVCDRLLGDLDASLHAVREACDSLDFGAKVPQAGDPANESRHEPGARGRQVTPPAIFSAPPGSPLRSRATRR